MYSLARALLGYETGCDVNTTFPSSRVAKGTIFVQLETQTHIYTPKEYLVDNYKI